MRRLADTQRALQAVERLQARLKERGEVPTEEKLSLLRSVLQSPLFHQILALQKSVQHLREQVNMRSGAPAQQQVLASRLSPRTLPSTLLPACPTFTGLSLVEPQLAR